MRDKGDKYFKAFFAIGPRSIKKIVVVSPIIYPKQFEKISGLKGRHYKSILGYLVADFKNFTFIKAPMTQSAVADAVFLLKKTRSREIYFLGAIGGLEKGLKVGDLVVSERAKDVYSVKSFHEETKQKMIALRKKGVLGVDFESQIFFRTAKKTGLRPIACYVVTDLPLSRPLHLGQTAKEKERIRSCLEYIIKLVAATNEPSR